MRKYNTFLRWAEIILLLGYFIWFIALATSCSSSRPGYKAQRVQQRHLQNQFPHR